MKNESDIKREASLSMIKLIMSTVSTTLKNVSESGGALPSWNNYI